VFVLNVLAFVIMGLQARPIVNRLSRESPSHALLVSGAVLATVIVVRIAYVMAYNTVARLKNRRFGVALRPGTAPTTVAGGVLVSWCGMRGLVTLATAFALPSGFPGRDLIVLSAFCVVLGTLVIQGFTLRPLLDNLGFEADGAVEREISHGRLGIMQAALDTLAGEGSPAAAAVREGYLAAREVAASPEEPQGATEYDHLRLRAIAAQRRTLHQLREAGSIGDEAFHRREEEADWVELEAGDTGREAVGRRRVKFDVRHLRQAFLELPVQRMDPLGDSRLADALVEPERFAQRPAMLERMEPPGCHECRWRNVFGRDR